ncbi:MAG TPA: hypothetical protein DEP53_10640 [Bacteroidetes bacterium]|nr:hypothetical protein [Bacteroidota bacterium]
MPTEIKRMVEQSMKLNILKLEGERTGTVGEISTFLYSLDQLYHSLVIYDQYRMTIRASNSDNIKLEYFEFLASEASAESHMRIPRMQGGLFLQAVEIHSPGVWEFLGSLSPLTFIRDFINDMYERRKDKRYRNREEERRLTYENDQRALENEELYYKVQREAILTSILRNQELMLDVKMMQELGLPKEKIDALLANHVLNPCAELSRFSFNELIGKAELTQQELKP